VCESQALLGSISSSIVEGTAYQIRTAIDRSDSWIGYMEKLAAIGRRLGSAPGQSERNSGRKGRKEILAPLLAKKSFSIPDWAREAHVAYHTVQDYFEGRTNPYQNTRGKLAKALGIKPEELPE
jgi:lambda repressor-like predicted transcriptional regulator